MATTRSSRAARLAGAAAFAFIVSFGPGAAGARADQPPPAAPAPAPVTTKDPQIALDELDLLLAPLTKEELEVETKGWFDLVRAKEREITVAELDVKRKNREIAQLEKQKTAAAELAKATNDVKATASTGGAASDQDKAAAAARLAQAQQKLAKTVEAASQESAKDEKKTAEMTAAMTKPADAMKAAATGGADAPPPGKPAEAASEAAAQVASTAASSDKDVLAKVAAAAAQKSEAAGGDDAAKEKAQQVVAATAKEAAATEQIKELAKEAPAAASSAVAAATTAPGAAAAAATETAKKAETLAKTAEAATAAKTDVKVQLVDYSTQLTSERTALVDRLKLVLEKFELRGGDPKPYRLYIDSIGGLKIDVTDKAATLARVKAWLTADEGGLRWARNFATFFGYVFGSFLVAGLVRMILRRALRSTHATSHLLRDFIISSSGRAIVGIGILLGLSALEVNLAPLLAVIGAAGFVVAFALQGTLSNFASGLLIMVFKPFDIGDDVEVAGDLRGKITKVTVFSTDILTPDGLHKIVPNDSIWKGVIVNHSTGGTTQGVGTVSGPENVKAAAD